jgi:large subunit ribosomal protein L22
MGKNASKRRRSRLEAAKARKAIPSAELHFLRMSASKVRLVANLIRGRSVEEAVAQLEYLEKAAAKPVRKLLRSAAANGENEGISDFEELRVTNIQVDGGPMMKRFLPRAMGRATPILKKTCHIRVELGRRN